MKGLVLCGGNSRRMKTDKGLLSNHGRTWTSLSMDILSHYCDRVYLSIRPDQSNAYSTLFDPGHFIYDNANIPMEGPLLGIISAHLAYPDEDFWVIACDFPYMTTKLLDTLYYPYSQKSEMEAFCFMQPDGYIQPLVAIYRATGLQKIYATYQRHPIKDHSVQSIFQYLNTYHGCISTEDAPAIKNCNSPLDIDVMSLS